MPTSPPAPASIEFSTTSAVAVSTSPFTGQQQVQDWGGRWMEAVITLPALTYDQAQTWVQWLRDVNGVAGVFQLFGSAFQTKYAGDVGTRYWRFQENTRSWSITEARVYGITFKVREAL